MSKNHCCGCCSGCNCSKDTVDPTSPNYSKDQKNKTSNNPPYGSKEPSTHTKHQ